MIVLLELIEESIHCGRNRTSFEEPLHSLDRPVVIDDTVRIISNDTETYVIDDGRSDLSLVLELVDYLLDLLVRAVIIDIIADDIPDGESCKDQDTDTDNTQREMRCDKSDHYYLLSVKFLREIVTRSASCEDVLIIGLIRLYLLSCSSYCNIDRTDVA